MKWFMRAKPDCIVTSLYLMREGRNRQIIKTILEQLFSVRRVRLISCICIFQESHIAYLHIVHTWEMLFLSIIKFLIFLRWSVLVCLVKNMMDILLRRLIASLKYLKMRYSLFLKVSLQTVVLKSKLISARIKWMLLNILQLKEKESISIR